MAIQKVRPATAINAERLAELSGVFPEAFADGKINWETLKQVLTHDLESDSPDAEHFGLFWPGKRQARRFAGMPCRGALSPVVGDGVRESTTRNVYVEADNLEALKLLRKSYAGQVKMIYIDPPYNTGGDFVYPDDYTAPLDQYLKMTGQQEDEQVLTTNPETSGRFHSNWLSMLYPRLILARQLLRKDGVIFISIDDHEHHHLRLLMNEVFGEENYICSFAWEKRYSPPPDTKDVGYVHESIVFYRKSEHYKMGLLPFTEEQKSRYKNPDNDSRGPWKPMDYTCRYTAEERPNLYYAIKNPHTKETVWPKKSRVWAFSPEVHKKNEEEKRIWWGVDGTAKVPALKNFISEIQQGMMPMSLLKHEVVGNTDEATKELREFFPDLKFTPKPVRLIKHLCTIANLQQNDLVLDFFAGVGTTAQAVLELNQDGANRRFLLIQFPEPISMKGHKTVSSLCKQRIRLVCERIEEGGKSAKGADVGFRSYKLCDSNFKGWRDYSGEDLNELQELFDGQEDPLIAGWDEDSLATEVALLEGFPLDSQAFRPKEFEKHKIRVLESANCSYRLVLCFARAVPSDLLKGLSLKEDDVFICLEGALTDLTKARLADSGNLKVI